MVLSMRTRTLPSASVPDYSVVLSNRKRTSVTALVNAVTRAFTSRPLIGTFGNRALSGYALYVSLGLAAGTFLWLSLIGTRFHCPLPPLPLVLGMAISSFIGSRILFGLEQVLARLRGERTLSKGGHAFSGGVLGSLLCYVAYVIIARPPGTLLYADCCAPAIGLGYGIGKLGCLSYGCCIGRPTPSHAVAKYDHAFSKAVSYYRMGMILLIPVQLYEAACAIVVCGVLTFLPEVLFGTGRVIGLLLVLLTTERVILMRFRYYLPDERATQWVSGVASGVLICLGLLLAANVLFQPGSFSASASTGSASHLLAGGESLAIGTLSLFLFGLRRVR